MTKKVSRTYADKLTTISQPQENSVCPLLGLFKQNRTIRLKQPFALDKKKFQPH